MRRPVTGLFLLAACSSQRQPAGLTTGDGDVSAAAIVAMGNGAAVAWPVDPILVSTPVLLRGDSLHIEAEHGGGCARHRYALIVGPAWMEWFPVQIGARLAHDAHGDPCRTLVPPRSAFSLLPARDAYRSAYGAMSATVIINPHPHDEPVEYRF